jgi:hypothetical protein
MRKLRRENVLSNPPSFAFFVDSISPPMQAHRAWLNADGLRMYTPYAICGNGQPDGTAPSGFIATDRSGILRPVLFQFQDSLFCMDLVPPFSGFFLHSPSRRDQPFA